MGFPNKCLTTDPPPWVCISNWEVNLISPFPNQIHSTSSPWWASFSKPFPFLFAWVITDPLCSSLTHSEHVESPIKVKKAIDACFQNHGFCGRLLDPIIENQEQNVHGDQCQKREWGQAFDLYTISTPQTVFVTSFIYIHCFAVKATSYYFHMPLKRHFTNENNLSMVQLFFHD